MLIKEVRDTLISSVSCLPFLEYRAALIAAGSSVSNSRVNYDSYSRVLNAIQAVLAEKAKDPTASDVKNLLNVQTTIEPQKSFNQNNFVDVIEQNFAQLVQKYPHYTEQVLRQSIFNGPGVTRNLVGDDSVRQVQKSLIELQKQMTSENFREYIKSKSGVRREDITDNVVEQLLSAIDDLIPEASESITDVTYQIDIALSEWLRADLDPEKDASTIQERTDIQYASRSNNGEEAGFANPGSISPEYDKVLKEIYKLIHEIPEFTNEDINNKDFGPHYRSLMVLLDSLAGVEIKSAEQIQEIRDQFNSKKISNKTFDMYVDGIKKFIESEGAKPKSGTLAARADTKILERAQFNNKDYGKIALAFYNMVRTPGSTIDQENADAGAKLIIACDRAWQISRLLDSLGDVEGRREDQGDQQDGGKYISSFSYSRFFEVGSDGKVSRRNNLGDLTKDFQFIFELIRRRWNRVPYLIMAKQVQESMSDLEDSMNNTVVLGNGAALDRPSREFFESLQIPEKYQETLAGSIGNIFKRRNGKNTPIDLYITNQYLKNACGFGGKVLFNLGKMAFFFVCNGGFQSFQKSLNFLSGVPGQFLKNSLIQPEEAKEMYRMIQRDEKLRTAYQTFQGFMGVNKDRVKDDNGTLESLKTPTQAFFVKIEAAWQNGKNKKQDVYLTGVVQSYIRLIKNPKILNIFARLSKPTNIWLKRNKNVRLPSLRQVLSGINERSVASVLDLADALAKEKNMKGVMQRIQADYPEFLDRKINPFKDPATQLAVKLIQIYCTGAAGEASVYDTEYWDLRNIAKRGGWISNAAGA